MKLTNYLQDGACNQARAVLPFIHTEIEESWNNNIRDYETYISVGRQENAREQGYVVSIKTDHKQLNIAFFEHRNSDNIHALGWEQYSLNTITLNDAEFGDLYKDKYDTTFNVAYGEITKLADWINEEFIKFYDENNVQSKRIKYTM